MKIGYIRVSTIDQNPALQLRALRQAGCEKLFEDIGISGANKDRPALDKALNMIKSGDVLVVWKLDRLGRSLGFLIELIECLKNKGAGFCSLTDGIDTTTSSGKLIFHFMGALAEFERDLISKRTRAGMAEAKARGSKIGRPSKLKIKQVKEAYAFYHDGDTLTEIAARYDVNHSTLSRAMSKYRKKIFGDGDIQ